MGSIRPHDVVLGDASRTRQTPPPPPTTTTTTTRPSHTYTYTRDMRRDPSRAIGAPRERGGTCARIARRADHTRRTHASIAFVTCALALRSAVEYAAATDGVFTTLSQLGAAVGACGDFSSPCTHG